VALTRLLLFLPNAWMMSMNKTELVSIHLLITIVWNALD
jgi:hypothetical protein